MLSFLRSFFKRKSSMDEINAVMAVEFLKTENIDQLHEFFKENLFCTLTVESSLTSQVAQLHNVKLEHFPFFGDNYLQTYTNAVGSVVALAYHMGLKVIKSEIVFHTLYDGSKFIVIQVATDKLEGEAEYDFYIFGAKVDNAQALERHADLMSQMRQPLQRNG
ncbi:hypothetical protein LT875_002455 [Salmonella enterica]|nr:hypothetical protein [Salmonella enterica]